MVRSCVLIFILEPHIFQQKVQIEPNNKYRYMKYDVHQNYTFFYPFSIIIKYTKENLSKVITNYSETSR